jgi:hypothetical protein
MKEFYEISHWLGKREYAAGSALQWSEIEEAIPVSG